MGLFSILVEVRRGKIYKSEKPRCLNFLHPWSQAWSHLASRGVTTTTCHSTIACPVFRSQPAYRVGRGNTRDRPERNIEDIMQEILTQGPVQAVIKVHTDLLMYRGGVYSLTNLARHRLAGYHAVKIVGWGVSGATRFWTVANTWGSDWGEGGHFRILRGNNECGIEDNVVAAWPRPPAPRHHHHGVLSRRRHHRRHHRHRGERRGHTRGHNRGGRRHRRNKHKFYRVG